MKTWRFPVAAMVLAGTLALSAAPGEKSTENEAKPSFAKATEGKQCGVTESQIISYLQNCSHHHTVYWLRDIPQTCHTLAGVENCTVATVFVNEGVISGHADAPGVCD